ncbi:MAG TPA: tryptophan 2,3-dioxygenase family protein [Ktedonobacterales bacterium]|jgi:tryptophan 2,3-dioxygenase
MSRAAHDTAKQLSEYETYLRTEELLNLQKHPEQMSHHDELQFQVVHQTFELWWKETAHELGAVRRLLQSGDYLEAARLLRRAAQIERLLLHVLAMLETMTPWDFLTIRSGLGHGSGMDSPGFRALLRLSPPLWGAFTQALERAGVSLADLYIQRARHAGLFAVAEGLLDYDEYFQLFRVQHYRLVERTIGPGAVGTGGTPMDVLARTLKDRFYPELWEVRDTLLQRASDR